MSEKTYSPVDVQNALKERLVKFENQLKDLHARENLRKDQHMEPGVHEAGHPGAEEHVEPGGHENRELPMPQSPPEQPVGSSHGIPQGQLQDLCALCGQPDMPGQCQCLNGGGNEGLMQQPQIDPNPTQPGNGVQSLALAEEAMEMKEWQKPWEKKAAGCEHGDTCKSCGDMSKGADFIDKVGKPKMIGNHPDAVLPDDKAPKKIKGPDDVKIKANGKGLAKVSVPMAKPPSGGTGLAPKAPAMAKPAVPKVGAPGAAPKPMGKGADIKPADKKAMASQAAHDSFKAKAPTTPSKPPPMVTKPPSHYDPAEYARKAELSKSMGSCLFCGNREHQGQCGLAKNIQTALAKAVTPLLIPQPRVKAAAAKLGHVATSLDLGHVVDAAGKTMAGPVSIPQAGTNPGSPARQKKVVSVSVQSPTPAVKSTK